MSPNTLSRLIALLVMGALTVLLGGPLVAAPDTARTTAPAPLPPQNQAEAVAAALGVNTAPTFVVGDGKVTTDFGGIDGGSSVVLQADGKIVVAGSTWDQNTQSSSFALARYLPDGSLDNGFGDGGKVITDFGGSDNGSSVALQADGKIVVAGSTWDQNPQSSNFALVRYLPGGNLDDNFGNGGKVITDFGGGDNGSSIVLQADGKLVVAGSNTDLSTGYSDFALARYLPDGNLDASFGIGGKVTTDFGAADRGQRVVLQTDGKIVVAGFRDVSGTPLCDFALARYQPDGSLDSSFGSGGKVTTDFGGSDYGFSIILQSDGKLLVAGTNRVWGPPSPLDDFAMALYHPNGSLDTSFGISGQMTTDLGGSDSVYFVALQLDGNIVVAGSSFNPANTGSSDFALARYLPNGNMDDNFGNGGKVITDFGGGDNGSSVVVQADGKIVVAGSTWDQNTQSSSFALARYLPDGSLDDTFGPKNTLANSRTTPEQYSITLAPGARVSDTELAALGTYDGAMLTLARQGGANAEDVFSSTGSALTVLTPGSYFAIDGVTIGQVVTNSGGILQLRFLGANANQYRMDKTLQQIAYTNTSDTPPAQVLIDWTFDDGNTGAQGTGGPLSTTGTVTVNITPVNDAPQLVIPPPAQTAAVGAAFNYTLPADTFIDPDGDPLSYSVVMADNTGVPLWLNFDAASRTFSGTPSALDSGATLNLRITAKDPSNASAQANLTIEVKAASSTALAAAPPSPAYGDSVTLTATVSGSNPTGSVSFFDGLSALGSGAVTGGQAVLATSSLGTGAHSLTAEYAGDANHAGSTSPALNLIVTQAQQAALTVTANPPSLVVSGGGGSTLGVIGGTTGGAVTYAADATGGASCAVAGNQLTASGGAGVCQVTATMAGNDNYLPITSAPLAVPVEAASRLVNISTRAQVGTGDAVMIGGFVIGGAAPRRVLIRAIGPSMAPGVAGTLANPRITLTTVSGTPVASNDNWQDGPNAAEIQTLGLQPANVNEAALLLTLDPNTPYTPIVEGVGGTSGVALVEIYDVDESNNASRLINISTRGRVGTGDSVMIGGFVIGGTAPRRVLIRAIGPSMAPGVAGTLANPKITLTKVKGEFVASNDNWQDDPLAGEIAAPMQPTNPKEAALLLTLDPNTPYTPIVKGVGGTSGVALVEIYEVP